MSSAAEASLGVIGVTVVAHTHMLDAVKAFVIAKKTDAPAGPAVQGTTSFANVGAFAKWAAAFTGLAFVLTVGSDSPRWGQVVDGLGGLIAVGTVFLYYADLLTLFGVGGATGTGPGGPSAPVPASPLLPGAAGQQGATINGPRPGSQLYGELFPGQP